jgi:hypothetical protein
MPVDDDAAVEPGDRRLDLQGLDEQAMPRGGRPLVIAKITPASRKSRTAAMASSVSTFPCVTSVPSTSASSSLTVAFVTASPLPMCEQPTLRRDTPR